MVADVSAGFAGTVIQPGEGALLGQATGLPTLSTDADLALALSDTLVNHLLYQAWRSGLMQIELSTQDGTLNGGMAEQLKAQSATVSLRSDLPPVVTSAAGGMRLDAAGLEVTIDTPGGDLGDHMVIDGSVNLLMDPQGADGWLNLGLGTPSMTLMVRENNWGASAEATTNLLEDMLPIEDLMAPMGTFSVPIPNVSKAFGVSGLTLGREQGWTRVGVGLE